MPTVKTEVARPTSTAPPPDLAGDLLERAAAGVREVRRLHGLRGADLLAQAALRGHLGDRILGLRVAAPAAADRQQGAEQRHENEPPHQASEGSQR